jgi:hypothetical protein
LSPELLDFDSSLSPDFDNKLEKPARPKSLEPSLNFGGRFIGPLSFRASSHFTKHVILILAVDVFHQEFFITG